MIIKNGTGPATCFCFFSQRYGDYFGASLDPSDPTVVWVAGEYGSAGTLWSTLIANVKVGNSFIVAATPTTLNLATGNSGTSTIIIASVGSFTGTVTLTATSAPSGPGTSLKPALVSLPAGGESTSTLTVTTKGSTLAGVYNINVTGTATGAPAHSAFVTINLSGFSLSLNPLTIAIPAGSSGNCNVALTSIFGFSGIVGITTTVSPAVTNGPTTSLNTSSIVLASGSSASSALTVSTLHKTPPGVYTVLVNATSGVQSHSLSLVAVITPIAFSINNSVTFTGALVNTTGTVSIDSPSNTLTLSGTISVTAVNSTSHAMLFSNAYPITGLPFLQNGAGLRAIFLLSVPVSIYPLTADIGLTLTGSKTGITLYVTRNIDLNGDGVVDLADINIINNDAKCGPACYDPRADIDADGIINISDVAVAAFFNTAPVFMPDFSLSPTPASLTILVGSSATSGFTLTSLEGLTGSVTLSSTPSGTGLTSSLSSTTVALIPTKTGSSTLTITVSQGAQPGSYTVTVTGTASVGVLTQSHRVAIQVFVPTPDFTISAQPNGLSVVIGSSSTSTITLTSILGFTGTVVLQATIINPPRTNPPTLSPSPASVMLTSGGTSTSTLTISAAANTPLGSYSAIINGTAGSLFHTLTFNFTVVKPDFLVSASPATLAMPAGSSATSTLNVTSINTFAGTVNITTTITPVVSGGPTSSLKSSTVKLRSGTSASVTLTIATTSLTPWGLYSVNVTLTSGTLVHSTFVFVIVTPVSFTLNNSTTFTGVNVNTTGTMSIDSPSSSFTISGTIKVTATNSTTGAVLFSKTYTIALLGARSANSGGVVFVFIMNVQVRPYNLSSDVSLTVGSGSKTALVQVSRNIDFDNDGVVNMTEINTIASDIKCGAPCYDPRVDLDANGVINIFDLTLAATYYTAKAFS
jgi:uncharacterized membrane protein